MDFRQLTNFIEIVDAGSLTRAANKIGVAQPALTYQIARLEKELNCQLLMRSTRGVRPTDAGMVLYREASTIARRLKQIPKALQNTTAEPAGEVTIAFPNSLAPYFATATVAQVQEQYPRVKLHIVECESVLQQEQILKSRIDIGLVCEYSQAAELHHRPLFKQRLAMLCDSRNVKESGKPITFSELAKRIIGLPNPGNPVRIAFDDAARGLGLTVEARLEFNAMRTLTDAVAHGFGASINLWMPHEAKSTNGIVWRPIVEPNLWLCISLCRSRMAEPSPTALLVENIMEQVILKRIGRRDWNGAIAISYGG